MISLQPLFGEDATVLREANFQLLLAGALFPIAGTTLLSPVLDSLTGPFGTTPANIGLMISLYTAPGIVMIPIAGAIADRYGRKPVLVTSLGVFGVSGVAIAATTAFPVVLGLRLLQGIGAGGINPIIITVIGDTYSGSAEATGQGLRVTVAGISATVFPLVAGVLVVIAWQYPFVLYACALPVALAVALWFEEPTDRSVLPTDDDGDARSYRRALLRLVRRRRVVSLLIARALPPGLWFGFLTYNSILVVRLMDGTPPQAGVVAAVASVVFALAASQAGRVTNLSGGIFVPLVASNVCFGVGFTAMILAPGIAIAPAIVVASIGVAVMGVGFGFLMSLYRSLLTGIAPEALRGGLVGIGEAGDRLAATVAPIAMGGVVLALAPDVGFGLAVQIACLGAAAVACIGGILCLVVAWTAPSIPEARAGSLNG